MESGFDVIDLDSDLDLILRISQILINWQLTLIIQINIAYLIKEIFLSMKIVHQIKSTLFNTRLFASSFKPHFSAMQHEHIPQTLQKHVQAKLNQSQSNQNVQKQAQQEQVVVNPYMIANNTGKQIDYNKLIEKFGCYHLNKDLIARIQKLTRQPAHKYLTRDIFFSHRDLDLILTAYEKNTNADFPPFYLYTGRGPSSEALHLGHMLPFIFNKYLQEAFNVPFVVQITDDEKYFHKEGGDLTEFTKLAYENMKDILALGFDPEKTFFFIDSEYMGTMYPNVCRFQKHINMSTLKAIFGMDFSDCCGKAAYPAIQAAPCLSSTFPHIFGNKNIPCMIPCGIDQDPYFRMTRDVCGKLKTPKPAGLYSKFFPSLQGFGTKMSASNPSSGIFLTDTPKQIEKKINQAITGGGATKEEQEKYGADLSKDIPYYYLTFFMEDDKELAQIGEKYASGKMLSGQVKKTLIKIIQDFVKNHQERRAKLTDDDVKRFLSTHERKFSYQIDPQILKAKQKEIADKKQKEDVEKKQKQAAQKEKKQKKEKKEKTEKMQKLKQSDKNQEPKVETKQ